MLFRLFATSLAVICLAGCDSASKTQGTSALSEPAGEAAAELMEVSLPQAVSFNEHIQPILSEYCYHCHGPDSGTREPKSEPLRWTGRRMPSHCARTASRPSSREIPPNPRSSNACIRRIRS
jgi:hypothetical protein